MPKEEIICTLEEFERLKEDRDDLLEACKTALLAFGPDTIIPTNPYIKILNKAIARAERK